MYYDGFSISEQNSTYYGWAKKNTRPKIKSNESKRQRVNGLLSIDIETGDEYLWLSSHAQSDDIARYMAHLAMDMQEKEVEKLEIILDNNPTHKDKMKELFEEELEKLTKDLNIPVKTEVIFTYLPKYSPKLNLVEYAIHLIRQKYLHHRPYNMSIDQIADNIEANLKKHKLMTTESVKNTIRHMEEILG